MAAKLLRLGLVFVVLTALLTGVALAQGEDLISLVKAYQEAENSHDLDAIMAMYTAEPVFEIVGRGSFIGREQVRAFEDYNVGLNVVIQLTNCGVEQNTVTCEATLTSDLERAAGLPAAEFSSAVFTLEDGKIQKIAVTRTPESAQAMGEVIQASMEWAQANRPDELAKLFDENGQFIYSRESAAIVVSLLKEWRAAVPQTLPTTGGRGVPETLPLWLGAGGLLLLALGVGLRKAFSHAR